MSATRIAAALSFLAILAGTFALSKQGDLEILQRVGVTSVEQVRDGMPEASRIAGPLASLRSGEALPIEERVRVRLQADKELAGADLKVLATPTSGQVKLKGVVQSTGQKARAVELAERTTGVVSVVEELATPDAP